MRKSRAGFFDLWYSFIRRLDSAPPPSIYLIFFFLLLFFHFNLGNCLGPIPAGMVRITALIPVTVWLINNEFLYQMQISNINEWINGAILCHFWLRSSCYNVACVTCPSVCLLVCVLVRLSVCLCLSVCQRNKRQTKYKRKNGSAPSNKTKQSALIISPAFYFSFYFLFFIFYFFIQLLLSCPSIDYRWSLLCGSIIDSYCLANRRSRSNQII